MRGLSYILVALAALFCLPSCVRRPIETIAGGASLTLVNDYALPYEPAASTPLLYDVNMYDRQSGKLVMKDYVSEKGGRIRFLPGDFICFVYGLEDGILTVEDEGDAKAFHLTAPEAGNGPKALLAECRLQTDGSVSTESLLSVNGCFWAGMEPFMIPVLTDTDVECALTVGAGAMLGQGKITLRGIKGIRNIASTDCFVTNLSAGKNPVTGMIDETSITEIFPLRVQKDSVWSAFFFFGRTELQKKKGQMLYVVITDKSGERHHFSFDLKDVEPEGDMAYTVWLDAVIPGDGEQIYHLDVDEWEDQTKDIPMKN